MYRSTSPYRAPSPYGAPPLVDHHLQQLPSGAAQVGPGAVTYTASVGPDGRPIYQQFKAVAASYQTPKGIVNGIQWVPSEATRTLPQGVQIGSNVNPMEYTSSRHSSYMPSNDPSDRHDLTLTTKFRRYDDKARRRAAAQAKSEAEYELRQARERDSHSNPSARERRKSFSASAAAGQSSVAFPDNSNAAPYASHPSLNSYGTSPYTIVNAAALGTQPSTASSSHYRSASASYDLARQMEDLEVDSSRRDHARRTRRISGKSSSRRQSVHESTMNGHGYPQISSYHTSPNMQPATMPYGTAGSTGYPSSASYGVTGPQVYPPGHVLEGHPIAGSVGSVSKSRPSSRHGSRPPSRAPSPNRISSYDSYGQSNSTSYESYQLPAPEAFSRPIVINNSNTFAPFEPMRLVKMDELFDPHPKLSKLPPQLINHDVHPEDWNRFIVDLGRSWTGQLPVSVGRDGKPPKASTLASDLIDLWNVSYFFPRAIEMVVFKGCERRTGPKAGTFERNWPGFNENDESSSESSSDPDTSECDVPAVSSYGPTGMPQPTLADMQNARRRRWEEKRRRRKEKRARRKARARQREYSVYITYTPMRTPNGVYPNSPPSMIPPGYAPFQPPTMPVPYGKAPSHSYGGY
ncbi:hypothetical protein CVT24_001999 [Panaeolus cyanescens]|uniref:Uncharacterized protein n=1 Tax=Panaeolus cyanescens TaxID=181874 RepID=A0A409YHH3_9AGAR|nr:hypothetical protein CVT24_001999 [Panaeolus cyanescens]